MQLLGKVIFLFLLFIIKGLKVEIVVSELVDLAEVGLGVVNYDFLLLGSIWLGHSVIFAGGVHVGALFEVLALDPAVGGKLWLVLIVFELTIFTVGWLLLGFVSEEELVKVHFEFFGLDVDVV